MQLPGTATVWVAIPAGLGLALIWNSLRAASARRKATERLFRSQDVAREPSVPTEERSDPTAEIGRSVLERWLFVSGFRSRGASGTFLFFQALALVTGLAVTLTLSGSAALATGIQWLEEIPGGIGAFLSIFLSFAPWVLFFIVALVPVLVVRSRRQRIVQEVDRDLPIVLGLLSTLVESGLGFDAALDRILSSLDPERALSVELSLFRSETQAGVQRLTCFRRMARRVDVPAMSTFVSAVLHAENVGGGIAESLRRQADDVWNRRRDLAIQRAQSLPTKLAVPLVFCFLPGIFVFTFGPAVAQFLEIADGVVNNP